MIEFNEMYDISVLLGEEATDFPGDQPYSRVTVENIDAAGSYELSRLKMSVHTGTHIDTPAHFFADGKTIDQYDAGRFVLPALVVDITEKDSIKPETIKGIDAQPGDALLFRTENSASGLSTCGVFSEHFVSLSVEAAGICVDKAVSLAGIDYISIEEYESPSYECHRTLLAAGILILEGLNLKDVAPGRYTLMCFPLKMKGAEASPVRAVLIR